MGDITNERTDAIVNAANEHLAHSGGVAAAILRAGGPDIQFESSNFVNAFGPIKTTKCAYTNPGRLAANGIKYVIHAVGPEYNKNKTTIYNAARLHKTVLNALIQANKLGCLSVSIPAISSGIYGFPKYLCALVFFCAIKDFAFNQNEYSKNGKVFLRTIRLVNFDKETTDIFMNEL